MKKLMNVIKWSLVALTIVVLIFTMLTSYQFIFVKYFNSYKVIQLCIFLTMMAWGISMYLNKNEENYYPLIYIFFAVSVVFFMFKGVY